MATFSLMALSTARQATIEIITWSSGLWVSMVPRRRANYPEELLVQRTAALLRWQASAGSQLAVAMVKIGAEFAQRAGEMLGKQVFMRDRKCCCRTRTVAGASRACPIG
jgi:hypothetical protein